MRFNYLKKIKDDNNNIDIIFLKKYIWTNMWQKELWKNIQIT